MKQARDNAQARLSQEELIMISELQEAPGSSAQIGVGVGRTLCLDQAECVHARQGGHDAQPQDSLLGAPVTGRVAVLCVACLTTREFVSN